MAKQGKNIYLRKDGRWEGRYVKERIDGKAKYGYVLGHSLEDVEQRLAKIKEDGKTNKSDSFSTVSEEWLEVQKPQLKPSSVAKYTNTLNLYLVPQYGPKEISSITRGDIMAFSGELLQSGGVHNEGLAPKTVNSILSVMKNVFDYAQKEKGLTVADIRDISVKQPQKPLRVFSVTEQQTVSQYLCVNMCPCYLGIFLCMYTGLRIGEICALKWEDVFLQEQYIYVHKAMQRVQILDGGRKKTEIRIDTPKSACSIRRIPLPEEVGKVMMSHTQQRDAYLLTGMVHSFIEPRTMENQFKSVISACNIEDVNFHTLRHTFATRCIELGFDIKSLSEILGHANVNITLNRYVHPSMDLKKQNMDKLSGLVTRK